MNERMEQARLGTYGITVFHDDGITFFSITEDSEPNRTPMLMWKRDVGFETRAVIRDPHSDLEFTKPLEAPGFADRELLRLLRDRPQTFSPHIAAQLATIIERRHGGETGQPTGSG